MDGYQGRGTDSDRSVTLTQGTSAPFLGWTEAGVSVPGDNKASIISFVQVELFPVRCSGWLELGAKVQAIGLHVRESQTTRADLPAKGEDCRLWHPYHLGCLLVQMWFAGLTRPSAAEVSQACPVPHICTCPTVCPCICTACSMQYQERSLSETLGQDARGWTCRFVAEDSSGPQTHPSALRAQQGWFEDSRPEGTSTPKALPSLCPLQVATKAGIYDILNQLGFPELESMEDQPLSRLRHRWQEQSRDPEPCDVGDFL